MARALSDDLRKRIIVDNEKGLSCPKIATKYSIHVNTVQKLIELYRETGSYQPRKQRHGKKSCLTEELLNNIESKIYEQPDITLEEIIEEFKLPISKSMMSKVVKNKLKFRYKKNLARQWEKQASCD